MTKYMYTNFKHKFAFQFKILFTINTIIRTIYDMNVYLLYLRNAYLGGLMA